MRTASWQPGTGEPGLHELLREPLPAGAGLGRVELDQRLALTDLLAPSTAIVLTSPFAPGSSAGLDARCLRYR
jgi:hypothetical protein